jgi:thioredoxin-related protein
MKKFINITISLACLLLSACSLAVDTGKHGEVHHGTEMAETGNALGSKYAWKVHWKSLDDGIQIARSEGKPMFIDFGVHEGCERCEFMQKHVYSSDKIVDKINRDFVPIYIDLAEDLTPDEQALGERHDFHDECLLLFLDHKKEPFFDEEGGQMCYAEQIDPNVFIRYLDYVIDVHNNDLPPIIVPHLKLE